MLGHLISCLKQESVDKTTEKVENEDAIIFKICLKAALFDTHFVLSFTTFHSKYCRRTERVNSHHLKSPFWDHVICQLFQLMLLLAR